MVVVLFAVCFFLVDRGTYYVCLQAYQNILRAETGGMIPEALQHRAEVVVLGSSLARHHYVPAILENILGLSVYNLGADGQGLEFMRCAVDILLAHYTPKMIIFNISPSMLSVQTQALTAPRVTALAAYLDESKVVSEIVYARSSFERLKYVSRAFRFNDLPLRYVYNGLFPRKDLTALKGFSPLTRTCKPGSEPRERNKWALDRTAEYTLRAALGQVKKQGVQLIIVQSPHLFWRDSPESSLHELYFTVKKIAKEERVPFIEITPLIYEQFKDYRLYADASHLNYEGAKIFSSTLAERMLADRLIAGK